MTSLLPIPDPQRALGPGHIGAWVRTHWLSWRQQMTAMTSHAIIKWKLLGFLEVLEWWQTSTRLKLLLLKGGQLITWWPWLLKRESSSSEPIAHSRENFSSDRENMSSAKALIEMCRQLWALQERESNTLYCMTKLLNIWWRAIRATIDSTYPQRVA